MWYHKRNVGRYDWKNVNDEFVELTIIRHALNQEYIIGNRDELSMKNVGINCNDNSNFDKTNYDSALAALMYLNDSSDEEKKLVFISFIWRCWWYYVWY